VIVETTGCLGFCGLGPNMMIDGKIETGLSLNEFEEKLRNLMSENKERAKTRNGLESIDDLLDF
jgi:NADH:ubiquinone oxidoreductase subunit E